MLTSSTVELLNRLASESDSLYSDGGLLYKYSFGHRCAHTYLSKFDDSATDNEVGTLELFISCAVNTPYPKVVSPKVRQECSALLKALANDFEGYQGPSVHIEEDDISKTISLIYSANNDYHILKMFWSID
ncbi:hypothetical protein LL240_00125 [Oceanimonas baumannii]|uniref:hypothetical protein n=1 Tax=Oceanimonas baumannii TaxID=129578 RepID=UPI001D1896F1|nr:hypothetical protein [Oceanimonas baumannii]MCC4262865.1 hypothetical protein [Oceanimonas baumannii]